MALLGLFAEQPRVALNTAICKGMTVAGIYGRRMYESGHKMLAMLESGLDVRKVITHRLPAADFETAFAVMKRGECGKVVLSW